ncbi:VOC family protein [Candidatus Haliotispira prima]|uniref:VOC family protein n=1 Tax=Candidatus Haliotispira prima TaxID=3034016 RepID=A0ABY8MHM2_9SPIO|nr:VOC family protein [Candidatus Haliotispira prima]
MKFDKAIIPHLWFDSQAVEAAEFYCSLFPDSGIISKSVIKETPSGDCDRLSFVIWGQKFEAVSAGPYCALNPSISLMINFDPLFFQDCKNPEKAARDKLSGIWSQLRDGGRTLLELGEYDFSKFYGWVQDRYGLTWQLILTDPGGDPRPPVMPSFLFVGDNCGRAEEAGRFYQSIFPSSKEGMTVHYSAGMEPDSEDTVMFSDFQLGETWLTAADSAFNHQFRFNEALSLIIPCQDQDEINYFWNALSAVPEAEQCGWLKDKYGVSWQVVPQDLHNMIAEGNDNQKRAVTKAFLKMKKFNLAELHRAFEEQRSSS